MIKKDKIHITSRRVDSYNCVFNYIISARCAGKTAFIWNKAYKLFKHKHRSTIIIRRLQNDITDIYIKSIEKSINTFLKDDRKIEIAYKRGTIKDGIVELTINNITFATIIALSNPKSRAKSTIIDKPGIVVFDEFICDIRNKEKYLADEPGKFKEIYNTYVRCCHSEDGNKSWPLKCYFLGNIYSLNNPFFNDLGIDTLKLTQGNMLVDKKHRYLIYSYRITKALREKLKNENPLYQFEDDEYTKYAFDGVAINDKNININAKQPAGFKLKHVFSYSNHLLGIFKNGNLYWTSFIDTTNKQIYALDFNNLIDNSKLITTDDRVILYNLKIAIANRRISYKSISEAYLIEDIYRFI